MDQRGLVERAKRGDHDAFAVLAGAAIARLDAAARLILRDHELARDAVQESMVRAWRDLPMLRDVERFDAWLHRLLVNACLDLVRRRKRRAFEVELTPLHSPVVDDFAGDAPVAPCTVHRRRESQRGTRQATGDRRRERERAGDGLGSVLGRKLAAAG